MTVHLCRIGITPFAVAAGNTDATRTIWAASINPADNYRDISEPDSNEYRLVEHYQRVDNTLMLNTDARKTMLTRQTCTSSN